MPTGIAISDPRQQLFGAAARILLRDGSNGLTSRAVTTEAGCAKGVLHRHFTDFDSFLAELVLDRIGRLAEQAQALQATAGQNTVTENLARTMADLFDPVTMAIVSLLMSRDELRARLRQTRPRGIPILRELTAAFNTYLLAERARGRIEATADLDTVAPMLVGAAHLLFAGQRDDPPAPAAVRRMVTAALAGVAREPSP